MLKKVSVCFCLALFCFAPAAMADFVLVGGCEQSATPNSPIDLPWNESEITIVGTGSPVLPSFNIDIVTDHMNSETIQIKLVSPDETEKTLWHKDAGPSPLVGNFPNTLPTDLSPFYGENLDGTWTLRWKIQNKKAIEGSKVISWKINGCPPKRGDVNGDGVINQADYTLLLTLIPSVKGDANYVSAGDLNQDGRITPGDAFLWMREFGRKRPPRRGGGRSRR